MVTFKSLGRLGRFGNQLFQIAGTIGIARRNGMNFCFPRWVNYDHSERFGQGGEIEMNKFFENKLPEYQDFFYQYRWINWGYHPVFLKQDVHYDVCGHFQSERYFSHCMSEVRYYLKMKDEYKLFPQMCAIHWRAGDYQEGENVYHPRMTMEYYEGAMKHMPSDTRFMVFSDDYDAARAMFGNEFRYGGGEGRDYMDDWKAMKACNHFICANSSYSLMAAILSEAPNKVVVCPRKWFGTAAPITGDDCYPEKAIIV